MVRLMTKLLGEDGAVELAHGDVEAPVGSAVHQVVDWLAGRVNLRVKARVARSGGGKCTSAAGSCALRLCVRGHAVRGGQLARRDAIDHKGAGVDGSGVRLGCGGLCVGGPSVEMWRHARHPAAQGQRAARARAQR